MWRALLAAALALLGAGCFADGPYSGWVATARFPDDDLASADAAMRRLGWNTTLDPATGIGIDFGDGSTWHLGPWSQVSASDRLVLEAHFYAERHGNPSAADGPDLEDGRDADRDAWGAVFEARLAAFEQESGWAHAGDVRWTRIHTH